MIDPAIDEALLGSALTPSIRFYRWQSPALSFGYFGKFTDAVIYAGERDLVRRWTGGGIVFHGDDLTYSIVIPAGDPAFHDSSMTIYDRVHRALAHALETIGQPAVVARGIDLGRFSVRVHAAGCNCFANPVHADVMINGRKVAGAAQRRTRRGLLQQGSIQGVTLEPELAEKFATALSANRSEFNVDEDILVRAQKLAKQRYATHHWLRKR